MKLEKARKKVKGIGTVLLKLPKGYLIIVLGVCRTNIELILGGCVGTTGLANTNVIRNSQI